MKKLIWATAGLAALTASMALVAQSPAQSPADDEIRAMKDELERSRKIQLPNLPAPYFIQYLVDESESFSVSAMLGGLLSKRHDRFREPEIKVRVGDYKFDNTNFPGGFGGARYDLERFPLDNSYSVLRRYFWLETDSAYKAAVEGISRKRAAIRNLNQNEQLADFAHAEPIHHIHNITSLKIDEPGWTERVRKLSAVFSEFPDVRLSSIEFQADMGGYTMVNSEGTEIREPENVTYLRARAVAQSADGMTIRDSVAFHALDPAHMPGDAELNRGVRALAENVTALAKAPKGEDYSGPVLFEGTAGAQILAEIMGRNLALTRRPVAAGGRGGGAQPSELEGRIGARVLPDSFDVVDDPTQKEWRGKPLFGQYDVDREGVMAKPLHLVEKGVLKNYLLTRQPVKGYEASNGRARMPGSLGASTPNISNLFITTTDPQPVGELRKKLIELCQARSKPYGIVIKRMDYPSTATVDEARRVMSAQQGSARPISAPVLIYKLFPDGHEELVRGMRFRGLNVRSLKDVLAGGNDPTVFEYLDNPLPFALVGNANFTAETAVIAPSILIDDLELRPAEDELPKLPVVPPPTASR